MTVRPRLRCLRDDLHLPLPTARVPLDEIDHPILRKAAEQFAARDTPHERIASVDDVVLFKVKTGRWRGAVLCDEPGEDALDWLVAAGICEEGAPDDFYAGLHTQAQAARQRYNADHDKPLTTDTYCSRPNPPALILPSQGLERQVDASQLTAGHERRSVGDTFRPAAPRSPAAQTDAAVPPGRAQSLML